VPEAVKLAPAPAVVLTVTVVDFAPVLAGSKLTAPVVQELPEAIVLFAVQVPALKVKSVASLEDSGVADKMTGPPEAVKVTVPQATDVPTVLAPQVRLEGLAAKLPVPPVPERVKDVPVPALAATVTVSDLAPVVAGLKVIVPVVQEAPFVSTLLAVQVPKGAVKSVLSVPLNGVADKVTGPPEAVKVIVPAPQVAEVPAPTVPQVSEVGVAMSDPLIPVPEATKDRVTEFVRMAIVEDFTPKLVGLNCVVTVQVEPLVSTKPVVHVLALMVKSVESLEVTEVESSVKETPLPASAVKVIVPQFDVTPTPVLPQASVNALNVAA
jgi:hypothetical protein